MTAPRPHRRRKADRLLNPDCSRSEIECDYAIAPLDRLATQMDAMWGIDRLPEIVSPEMARRYGAAMAHLNECIRNNDPAATQAAAENCMRGLKAMDAAARASGAEPARGDFWEYRLEAGDGRPEFHFCVMAENTEWQSVKAKRPELLTFTMREVALALQAQAGAPIAVEAKKMFPGAEITKIREKPNYDLGGDEIPF